MSVSAKFSRAMQRHRLVREQGTTEVLGSLLTIAVVVTLVAVAVSRSTSPEAPPSEDIRYLVNADAGDDHLLLTHTGGRSVDAGDLDVIVVVDGVELYRSELASPGTPWRLGDDLLVGPFPSVLPVTGRIEVSLIRPSPAGATTLLPSNRYDLAAFEHPPETARPTVAIAFANSLNHTSARGTDTLFVQATVDHPEGRKLIRVVEGRIDGTDTGWSTLRDDGTLGDPVSGDGYYTAEITLPVDVPAGTYPLTVMAEDLYGNRVLVTGSVEVVSAQLPAPSEQPAPTPPPATPPPSASSPPLASPPESPPSNSTSPESPPPGSPPPATPPTLPPQPTPPTTPTPPFRIDPSGGVRPLCNGPFQLVVIGADITYGPTGPRIPVYADLTLDGVTISPLFGGGQVWGGESYTNPLVTPSMVIGARGMADGYGFRHAYNSFTSDPHVRVLKDGDAVPTVAGYGTQPPVEKHLAPYVKDGNISLAYNEIIVLYEFNPSLTTSAADFQDLVLLFRFPGGSCPT